MEEVAVSSTAPYAPRADDWGLGVALAMASGVIAGFGSITDEFDVEPLSGVTTAVGIVGGLGILVCWITGTVFGGRAFRGLPWILGAVALWVLQVVLLHVVGWRVALTTAGFLAAAVVVVGWLRLHRYVVAAYAWIALLAVGAVGAALAPTYPLLVAALVTTPLLTMLGAAVTQSLAARRYSAAR
jgi:hypothetical protein